MLDFEGSGSRLELAMKFITEELLAISASDEVLITCDDSSDFRTVCSAFNAVTVTGASCLMAAIPQLPYQGKLADPYIPEALTAALASSTAWLDCTFPYLSGSSAHAAVMAGGKTRMLALHGLSPDAVARLFDPSRYGRLVELQARIDGVFAGSIGASFRVTSPAGTDVTFNALRTSAKPKAFDAPGSYTPLGSSVIYPETSSVKGRVVLEGGFHEYIVEFASPLVVHVDGEISHLEGGDVDRRVMERSLRRANGGKGLGSMIHFSYGFHPRARRQDSGFIEKIRVVGANAIGFGIPWWEEGGGENHPDGIVNMQSMWIDDRQLVRDGLLCDEELADLQREID